MKRSRLVLAAAVLLAWCGDNDRSRSPTAPTSPTPVAAVLSLEITGATTLTAIGQTSQLTAIARFDNGSSRDVTAEAMWRAFNAAVVSLSPAGSLRAIAPGRTGITAQFQTKLVSREVLVLPSGTFILRGRITEAGNLPVAAAKVEIVDGPHAGKFTNSGFDGAYELFGIAGQVMVMASRGEYISQTKSASMTDDRMLDFELQPRVAPIALAGNYRVTFAVSSACNAALPEAARVRSYGATIAQDAARVEVELSDAQFAVNPRDNRGRRFSARLRGNALSFTMGDTYYGYFEDLVEQLDPTTYLTINGYATANASPSQISGPLQGVIAVWDAPNGFYGFGRRQTGSCRGEHPFVFAR
jgi:hypothetical protein